MSTKAKIIFPRLNVAFVIITTTLIFQILTVREHECTKASMSKIIYIDINYSSLVSSLRLNLMIAMRKEKFTDRVV